MEKTLEFDEANNSLTNVMNKIRNKQGMQVNMLLTGQKLIPPFLHMRHIQLRAIFQII